MLAPLHAKRAPLARKALDLQQGSCTNNTPAEQNDGKKGKPIIGSQGVMVMHMGALRTLGLSLVLSAQASLAASVVRAEPIHGTWENPTGDVRVITQQCGTDLCGKVSWASELAKRDASAGGTPQLVGTSLLRNYRQTRPGHWKGNVFVPDLGETYYSTIKQLDANRIKISGCILGGLLCKSQVWRKL